jgi:hypothetical protein
MTSDGFVPAGFEVPTGLTAPPFRLEPLGPQHNDADYAAWMSSIEHISATPGWAGSDWPDPTMTAQDNLGDLERHAQDFEQRKGFTYTVIEDGSGEIIGCVYIYPPRSQDGAAAARVSSWVRADRASLDAPLYRAVRDWLAADWPFASVAYDAR